MSIKPIITIPDHILKEVSKPVAEVNDEIRTLCADMIDSMYDAKGIGLAAIQIGVPLRVIVMDLEWGKEGEEEKRAPRVFINPEIIEASEDTAPYQEGCLSVPDYYDDIERPAKVKVKFLNEKGEEVIEDADGLFATCIQHEMDHLEGILFIDHLSRIRRERAVAKVKKFKKLNAA